MRDIQYKTHSAKETQRIGSKTAGKILLQPLGDQAVVLTLQGELGAGKTTFTQGFAAGIGVKEVVLSPSFLIIKSYSVPPTLRVLYHIDCYRLKTAQDLFDLGWEEIVQNPCNIVLVEWPERVPELLRFAKIEIVLQIKSREKRELSIYNP